MHILRTQVDILRWDTIVVPSIDMASLGKTFLGFYLHKPMQQPWMQYSATYNTYFDIDTKGVSHLKHANTNSSSGSRALQCPECKH